MASTCTSQVTPIPSPSLLDGKVSQEDADRLAKHFKDPEFCKLFEEYAREIADPKARAEQDAYLAQLESAGELEGLYGKGVQVIQADPGMVVKTKSADGAARVYINICTCPKVGRMVVEQSSTGERRGCSITLPNMMNVKGNREGKAPNGATFKTFDFIVHPDTLPRCAARRDLLENLIIMAIEKVEEVTHIKLLRKYKLPTVPYKGVDGETRPPALLLRTAGEGEVVDGRLRPLGVPGGGPPATGAAAAGAGAGADLTPAAAAQASSKDAGQHTASGRSGFSFGSQAKRTRPSSSPAGSQDTAPTSCDRGAPAGVQTPAYQVVERARVDLGSAWSDTGRALQISNSPEALVVRVELPGVNSAAGIQLALQADSLALEVPGKYKLQLPLKCKISEQQATAKFITSKQMMVLTLPVVQPAALDQCTPGKSLGQALQQGQLSHKEAQLDQEQVDQQQEPQQQEPQPDRPQRSHNSQQERAAPVTQEDSSSTGSPGGQPVDQSTPQERLVDSPAAVPCSSSVQQAGVTGTRPASPALEPCAAHSSLQPQPAKTENQLRWEALHQQPPSDDAVATNDPEVSHTQQPPAATVAPAQPAMSQAQHLQPCSAAAGKVAAPLRPRLTSRRISAADFV